ncbi:GIN domain-containing protein [Massilia antarctica]|uniref:GIN domain-containing protein n=1 Tax=Massilia antarctica TaxID=2765360 RepID=UPI0006BB73E8|nr:DUF2807 domain-containing protein [Massilia sp. H27-R4]MCY0913865.1 DUF2807 domain-containing protein [Massilia sp. H27-R4]CUI04405.1 Lipoprotein, putative [Janthinobacterium sp. CG23_2]CUU28191.1 Lipoprotein, putative [Janthinobacterium sp. CG23_2]
MNQFFHAGALAAALCALFAPARAASDGSVTETRMVDARAQRVRLDGAIDLRVRQGAVPSLLISGDKRVMSSITTEQDGDTLSIGSEGRGNSVLAELTLPSLREVASESIGWTDVSGFSGDELELSLEGAGSMKVNCNYRLVSASLGGVGSMNLQGVASDGVDLVLRGAGYATLSGGAKWLKVNLGGLGGLDAQHFQVDSVTLDLNGLGNAAVMARQSATLRLSGLGSVTVYGKPPNRNVKVDGLGKVSWK